MRAVVMALALAACQPSVASGTYECGAEELCPDGEACDGVTDTCVTASTAMPFTCADEHEPDNSAQQAFALASLPCAQASLPTMACMSAGDTADWTSFVAPPACSLTAQVSLLFPIAYEPLSVQLWDLTSNAMVATGGLCGQITQVPPGDAGSCIAMSLVAGDSYGIAVVPAGGGDCAGKCNFNRYTLTLDLTP